MADFRWQLEELRVSLFAQELRTPQPVSAKRLDKVWSQLDKLSPRFAAQTDIWPGRGHVRSEPQGLGSVVKLSCQTYCSVAPIAFRTSSLDCPLPEQFK